MFQTRNCESAFFLYRPLFSSVTLWTHGTNPVHPRTEWNDWSRAWARLTYFCPIAERDILRSLLTPSLAGSHIEPLMCLCPGRKTTQSHTVLGKKKGPILLETSRLGLQMNNCRILNLSAVFCCQNPQPHQINWSHHSSSGAWVQLLRKPSQKKSHITNFFVLIACLLYNLVIHLPCNRDI